MRRASVNREYRVRLERVLADHGITAFRYVPTGNCHVLLVVEHAGRTLRKTIPSSPSDHRGPVKAVSDLRRMLRRATG
jgi:hypothetical protein